MELTKVHKIIIVIIFILIIGLFIQKISKKSDIVNTVDNSSASSTTTNIPGTNLSVEGRGYTITQVPINETKKPTIPDLNRDIKFGLNSGLNDEAKKIITEKILALQSSLKKDPTNIANWIQLGVDQKIAGDYDGAIISWKYASDVSSDSISLGNLGQLYAYYLKDNAMAEVYYKKAISRSPTQAYLYVQLSDVYKLIFKDDAKALQILNDGLKQIPNDSSLLDAKKRIQ